MKKWMLFAQLCATRHITIEMKFHCHCVSVVHWNGIVDIDNSNGDRNLKGKNEFYFLNINEFHCNFSEGHLDFIHVIG